MTLSALSRRSFLEALGLPALRPPARARAAVLIRLDGGLSHLDSFDPKPEAPQEIRGEFRSIPSAVPGLRLCEHLPRLARRARRLTILRSLSSRETHHERAAGLLEIAGAALKPERIAARRSAWGPAQAGERYGPTPVGAACLAARRRLEAGARLVVIEPGWAVYDTHAACFALLRDRLLPELDWALSALLDELAERGLLETTLVVAAGEFGRTPRINPRGGRDHHAAAWSALLAGGGLEGGRALGATDRYGAEVRDLPVRPEDLARTILALLGRDPHPDEPAARGRIIAEVLAS